jgi:hypothetical protein
VIFPRLRFFNRLYYFWRFIMSKLKSTLFAVSVLSFAAIDSAMAAVDLTGFDTAKADVASIGGGALGVLIAAAAFKYVRRAL